MTLGRKSPFYQKQKDHTTNHAKYMFRSIVILYLLLNISIIGSSRDFHIKPLYICRASPLLLQYQAIYELCISQSLHKAQRYSACDIQTSFFNNLISKYLPRQGSKGRGVTLITHLHLAPSLRMSRSIPIFPHTLSYKKSLTSFSTLPVSVIISV
jgi:hypothetical protein